MAERLETKLKRAYLDLQRKARIQKFIKALDKKKSKLERELNRLKKYMEKEYLDIVKLEKKALRPLFQTFLGTLEEALDKERQEYLIAVLKYQSKVQEIKAVQFQSKVLKDNLVELSTTKKEYEKLKQRYFLQVHLNSPKKAKRLAGIKDKVLKLQGQTKEVRQAFAAGKKVLPHLAKLKAALQELNPWGLAKSYMNMGGRGRFSSYKKKKFIDNTKVLAFRTKKHLDKFELELRDVSKSINVKFEVEVHTIHEFLDVFFDNLITDWIVKEKIELAIMSIDIIQERISRTDRILEFEKAQLLKEIKKWEDRATEILLE